VSGIQGHLRLVCGLDETGQGCLKEQSFRVPVHLSKPHRDEGMLIVNVVTPTAGFFSGDELKVDVRVETGAQLLLTTPSACRVHLMRDDGEARTSQRFSVAARARLEVWPEILIPQAGSRFNQTTRIDLEHDAELIYIETVAPGRVASKEVFGFESLSWKTDLFYGGQWIVRERFQLSNRDESLAALKLAFPSAYYASLIVIAQRLDQKSSCWSAIHELKTDDLIVGCTRLNAAGSVIKIIARDSIVMRRSISKIREIIYASAGWKMPSLRRT
jgi:urease accessory protein